MTKEEKHICIFCDGQYDIFGYNIIDFADDYKPEDWNGCAHVRCIIQAARKQYVSKELKELFREWLGV